MHSLADSPAPAEAREGRRITVQGQVQGVGFRPCIYRLARSRELSGFVRNTPEGVQIEVHGPVSRLTAFLEALRRDIPPQAAIADLRIETLPFDPDAGGFAILASEQGAEHAVLISPDIAICPSCRKEMDEPSDRRYRYPFTNCTDCGPRYTITARVPYDRSTTSMACFPLCPECRREYADPLNRRFHAQPNACPVCGPRLWAAQADGTELGRHEEALRRVAKDLALGRIAAVKGLGGFHLACNAMDPAAVRTLRERKHRPAKPLAVMAPDVEIVRRLAHLSPAEEAWLSGQSAPIVLLPKRPGTPLVPEIAPDADCIGIMLPYTPLHRCLLWHLLEHTPSGGPVALVMTSGNASQEPIALGNREALRRLSGIADVFLLHNRDILVRCDDSVLSLRAGDQRPLLFRRARGFTPKPVPLSGSGPPVLGLGAESKATVCLTKEHLAFVSQHIGDLENEETLDFYRETIEHLQGVLGVRPQAVVRDLHPDYLSSRFASELPDLPVLRLQHHQAHIQAVLAENGHCGPALGLALDGTGLGDDGTLWGGELLWVDPESTERRRLGHFRTVPLPGGEAAIAEPWRTAFSYLFVLGLLDREAKSLPWSASFSKAERLVGQMLEKEVNCIPTSSCGRLFDAVAALLGICCSISYEGQAAVRLESLQDHEEASAYPCPTVTGSEPAVLDTGQLFTAVFEDWLRGVPAERISRRFHLGLCRGAADWALEAAERTSVQTIALSGGVLQNRTFARELPRLLRERGLSPLLHTALPPNDACISLGQAAFARAALRQGRI